VSNLERHSTPGDGRRDWEDLARDVGLPEQAIEELKDFLAISSRKDDADMEGMVRNNQLLAKGMALQQAGIIPLNMDIEAMEAAAMHQMTLEGLLKGY